MMSALESSSLLGAVMGSIPAILLAVGMWMFYVTCRNTQAATFPPLG